MKRITIGALFACLCMGSVALAQQTTEQTPPPDPTQTNVYFDQEVVLYDPANGWHWTSSTTIVVEGAACERLKKGQVKQVQIVSGCPTKVAN